MKIERPNFLHPKSPQPVLRTNFAPSNFAQVDGFLMRSSQPAYEELKYLKDSYGLTDVVNVSNNCPITALKSEEKAIIDYKLGYYNIPSETDYPTGSNIEKFLKLTEKLKQNNPKSKLLVHCNAGVDRTGTYVLFYELFNKLKNLNDAIQEMIDMGHWQESHPKLIPNIKNLVKEMKL